mmetsp:Transcript_30122/g.79409  ORF Transcript_30122/g.79409 Transcript_30122/m.79409 type:complete len:366 (-) Transcript_30122:508-1605(-)
MMVLPVESRKKGFASASMRSWITVTGALNTASLRPSGVAPSLMSVRTAALLCCMTASTMGAMLPPSSRGAPAAARSSVSSTARLSELGTSGSGIMAHLTAVRPWSSTGDALALVSSSTSTALTCLWRQAKISGVDPRELLTLGFAFDFKSSTRTRVPLGIEGLQASTCNKVRNSSSLKALIGALTETLASTRLLTKVTSPRMAASCKSSGHNRSGARCGAQTPPGANQCEGSSAGRRDSMGIRSSNEISEASSSSFAAASTSSSSSSFSSSCPAPSWLLDLTKSKVRFSTSSSSSAENPTETLVVAGSCAIVEVMSGQVSRLSDVDDDFCDARSSSMSPTPAPAGASEDEEADAFTGGAGGGFLW